MPDETPAAPALGFSVNAKLNNKRDITVQSFVPLDADPAAIAKILDKVLDQLDRQDTRYRLKDLHTLLENDENTLANHVTQVADLQNAYVNEHAASGRRGEFALKGQQKTNVENLQKTITGLRDRIGKIKAEIVEGTKMVQV